MTAPPAVLSYANPRGGQPLGSLFVVDDRPDGVVLTRPLPPSPAAAVAVAGLGLLTAVVSVGSAVVMAVQGDRGRPWQEWAILVVLVAGLFAITFVCGTQAWRLRLPRTLTVVLAGRRLTVVNGVLTVSGRPWPVRAARGFSVTVAQPSVTQRRMVAAVRVHRRFGFDRSFLFRLPRDECVWIAAVLNAALAAAVTRAREPVVADGARSASGG